MRPAKDYLEVLFGICCTPIPYMASYDRARRLVVGNVIVFFKMTQKSVSIDAVTSTLVQHCINVIHMFCVYWVISVYGFAEEEIYFISIDSDIDYISK